MVTYTQLAMCKVVGCICLYMVPVKFEKYSLKGEIFGRKLVIYPFITT